MNIIDETFILLRGMFFAYIIILGCYMLFSNHSVFTVKVKTSKEMRQSAGSCISVWAFTFLTGFVSRVIEDNFTTIFVPSKLELMVDLLVIPVTLNFLLRLVQLNKRPWFGSPLMYIVPMACILAYVVTGIDWIPYVYLGYWGINAIGFIHYFVRKRSQYRNIMHNNYSNIMNKELRWTTMFFILLLVYVMFFLALGMWQHPLLRIFMYFTCSVMWSYVVWHVDHQELLPNFWDMIERDKERNNYVASDADVKGAVGVKLSNEDVAAIDEALKKRCAETNLFLTAELTLTALAQTIDVPRDRVEAWFEVKQDNFYNYINSLRVDYAAQLLVRNPNLTEEEVAGQCGFSDSNTLRRVFTDRVGCSPSQYAGYVADGGGGRRL